ncbi:uncharacterized protein B0H64DRAFT_372037 [Chaetomium fimeti]|uniref:Uncharacterized protein n=1 Tax=Chaetomium fimeti TaxID=1854472 RepID=A0AAE0LTU5_9PEZI|nr:hypothetical protein B0H64DRAFT_372037 [Chaetomium fimeti]
MATYPPTCPNAAIPDIAGLPVPHDINLMIVPEWDKRDPAMVACCDPNPVQVVKDCWLWCEVPASYFDNGTANDAVKEATSSCLRINGRNITESRITGWQFNTAGRVGADSVKTRREHQMMGTWAQARERPGSGPGMFG